MLASQERPLNGSITVCEVGGVACPDGRQQKARDLCHVRMFISKGAFGTDACIWTDVGQAGLEWIFTFDRAEEFDVSRAVGVRA